MADEQPQPDPNSILIADTNVKIRDLEEKQNLIKDRILLIGENFISEKEETTVEIQEIKNQTKLQGQEIEKIKLAIQNIIETQENFARKSEIEILKRQFQMFQPLELARIEDVKDLIRKAIKNKKD